MGRPHNNRRIFGAIGNIPPAEAFRKGVTISRSTIFRGPQQLWLNSNKKPPEKLGRFKCIVESVSVVVNLHISRHHSFRLFPRKISPPIEQLDFHAVEKALHHCIVPAVFFPAFELYDPVF